MAENNRPDETKTKDVLDFGEYNTKDDNNENGIHMAEKNWPDERETNDLLDFGEYHTKDDNNEYRIPITSASPVRKNVTHSIRGENDPNFDNGSTYPITVSCTSEFSTLGASRYRTENNNSASKENHELLVARSPRKLHDHNQQVIDKLKKENTELKQKKMCVICRIKDFEYVIQPCGHLTCDVCSELNICICNAHVTGKHVCILSRTFTS